MWFFTADLHLDHANIMKYMPNRYKLWQVVSQMNQGLIDAWNGVVCGGDVVVVAGDLTLYSDKEVVRERFIQHLKGNIIWIKGNHDYWLKKQEDKRYMYHTSIGKQFIAVSHYPMRSWNKSQHGSWNLHGHTHGNMEPLRNQLDVGVDNAFNLLGEHRPFRFDEIQNLMRREDNETI